MRVSQAEEQNGIKAPREIHGNEAVVRDHPNVMKIDRPEAVAMDEITDKQIQAPNPREGLVEVLMQPAMETAEGVATSPIRKLNWRKNG